MLTRLFGLRCRHDYFPHGQCPVLALAPSPAGLALLRQYGWVFRAEPGGGAVYCSDTARASTFASTLPLEFMVHNQDPDLLNYSVLTPGLHKLGSTVFYADNSTAAGPPDGKAVLLGPPFADSALPLWGAGAGSPLMLPGGAVLSLLDRLARTVWQHTTGPQAQPGANLAFQGVPDGAYTLTINGSAQAPSYLRDGGGAGVPFGVLAIFPGGPLQAPALPAGQAAIGADGVLTPRDYELRLLPRHTRWRYYLHSSSPLDGYIVQAASTLSASETVPQFTLLEKVGSNGPWVYQSAQALPMQAVPSRFIVTLSAKTQSRLAALAGTATRLPYARGATLVTPDPAGGPALSNIYVYF